MANLFEGSRGPEVVTLQRELNRQLFPRPGLSEDGIFGPLTRSAVVAFQRQAGLTPDGILGPMTRARWECRHPVMISLTGFAFTFAV